MEQSKNVYSDVGKLRSRAASYPSLEGVPERLVKSTERVRDLGEVFTPVAIVQDMLNLLPADIWQPHPAQTFLEPACGDGNFLVAILARKLEAIEAALTLIPDCQQLEMGSVFALESLASIYGVDISADNVNGGTPGHEIGARERLLHILSDWHAEFLDEKLESDNPILLSAKWIVERNIQVANMLPFGADGKPSGRQRIPLIEYSWNPEIREVAVSMTTLGAVMEYAEAELSDSSSLFGPTPPQHLWTGSVVDLYHVPIPPTASNSKRTAGKQAS